MRQVAGDLQAEGEFSSNAHYNNCGLSFSCSRSTQHLVHKYAPLVQYIARAVEQLVSCDEAADGTDSSSSSSSKPFKSE
jgi:hypothetical protein